MKALCPLLFAIPLILTGCGDKASETFVKKTLSDSENTFKLVESSRERFRYQVRDPQPDRPSAPAGETATEGPRLIYTTPEGWTENATSAMRDINLSFGENNEGECYVARLPGAGGGLSANVNRWRKQVGADELSDEEIAALPKQPLFGQPATLVDVEGDFTGMGGGEGKKDYRLLGLIFSAEGGAVFVKMTGPRDLVEANREAFDVFTQSIDVSMN